MAQLFTIVLPSGENDFMVSTFCSRVQNSRFSDSFQPSFSLNSFPVPSEYNFQSNEPFGKSRRHVAKTCDCASCAGFAVTDWADLLSFLVVRRLISLFNSAVALPSVI